MYKLSKKQLDLLVQKSSLIENEALKNAVLKHCNEVGGRFSQQISFDQFLSFSESNPAMF